MLINVIARTRYNAVALSTDGTEWRVFAIFGGTTGGDRDKNEPVMFMIFHELSIDL